MKLKMILGLWCALCWGLLSTEAWALQIAWIDTDQVMQEERSRIDGVLQKEFGSRIKAVNALQTALSKDQETMKRDGEVMSAQKRTALERSIRNKTRDFEMKRDELNEELAVRNETELKKFIGKVNGIVEEISKKNKYDVVFQKNATIFLSPQYDITDQVMGALGFRGVVPSQPTASPAKKG